MTTFGASRARSRIVATRLQSRASIASALTPISIVRWLPTEMNLGVSIEEVLTFERCITDGASVMCGVGMILSMAIECFRSLVRTPTIRTNVLRWLHRCSNRRHDQVAWHGAQDKLDKMEMLCRLLPPYIAPPRWHRDPPNIYPAGNKSH